MQCDITYVIKYAYYKDKTVTIYTCTYKVRYTGYHWAYFEEREQDG